LEALQICIQTLEAKEKSQKEQIAKLEKKIEVLEKEKEERLQNEKLSNETKVENPQLAPSDENSQSKSLNNKDTHANLSSPQKNNQSVWIIIMNNNN
jgi:hypothetical protein